MSNAFRNLQCLVTFPLKQSILASQAIQFGVRLDQKSINRPGRSSKPLEQFWQGCKRLAIVSDLPSRKAIAALRTAKAKNLIRLPLGVDRYATGSDQLRKLVGAQHILSIENLRRCGATASARRLKGAVEIVALLGHESNRVRGP